MTKNLTQSQTHFACLSMLHNLTRRLDPSVATCSNSVVKDTQRSLQKTRFSQFATLQLSLHQHWKDTRKQQNIQAVRGYQQEDREQLYGCSNEQEQCQSCFVNQVKAIEI